MALLLSLACNTHAFCFTLPFENLQLVSGKASPILDLLPWIMSSPI